MLRVSSNPKQAPLLISVDFISDEWKAIKPALDHINGCYEQYVSFFVQFAYNLLDSFKNNNHAQLGSSCWVVSQLRYNFDL
jgi:hypothetical protein